MLDGRWLLVRQASESSCGKSKTANLLKNTGILAIGSFSSKILVFLLVPLYTAYLMTGRVRLL